jgi:hypothetical protein
MWKTRPLIPQQVQLKPLKWQYTESYTVIFGYDMMDGTEYFLSLQISVVLTDEYNVTINSEEIIGSTEYLMQQTMAHKVHLNSNVLSKPSNRGMLIDRLRVQTALPDIMKLVTYLMTRY